MIGPIAGVCFIHWEKPLNRTLPSNGFFGMNLRNRKPVFLSKATGFDYGCQICGLEDFNCLECKIIFKTGYGKKWGATVVFAERARNFSNPDSLLTVVNATSTAVSRVRYLLTIHSSCRG